MYTSYLRNSRHTKDIFVRKGDPNEESEKVEISIEELERKLSPREIECLDLKCLGRTMKEIGALLGISPHTVRNYITYVYDKLDVRNPIVLCSLIAKARSEGERNAEPTTGDQVNSRSNCVSCND